MDDEKRVGIFESIGQALADLLTDYSHTAEHKASGDES